MRALLALLCATAFVLPGRAEDIPGRAAFEAGVAAAEASDWQRARQHFEVSLAQADKPATRFNLILANHEAHEPLEVVHHALAFLASADQPQHLEARTRAQELLELAAGQLALVTTQALPASAELFVDGAPPRAREHDRVYVTPGRHRLEVRLGADWRASVEVELAAQQITSWPTPANDGQTAPRAPTAEPPPAPAPAAPRPAPGRVPERLRTQVAWTFGSMGAALQLSALGTYLGAVHQADEISQLNLYEGPVTGPTLRYGRLHDSTMALAFGAGALLAAAVAVSAHLSQRGSVAWAASALFVGSVAAGAGLALMIRTPPVIEGSDLDQPTRPAGSLLLASALPFFAYGISFLVTHRRGRAARAARYAWGHW